MLPFTGASAMVEGRQDADSCMQTCHHIKHRDAGSVGRAIGVTCETHESGYRLYNKVVSRQRCSLRSSETTDGSVDDSSVPLLNRVVIQAEALESARLEILDEDIGASCKLLGQAQVVAILEIERDRALIAIDRHVIGCYAIAIGRHPAPCVIPGGALNLNHRRTEIPKQHGAVWTGEHS